MLALCPSEGVSLEVLPVREDGLGDLVGLYSLQSGVDTMPIVESKKARLWDRSFIGPEHEYGGFQTWDGKKYVVLPSGAFYRLDKDRRSKKERRKLRRTNNESH